MTIWTDKTVSLATGGKALVAFQAGAVVMDSRAVAKGDLFIALKGEQNDGHSFVRAALDAGASAAIVDHYPEGVSERDPVVLVPDVLKALNDLAAFNRNRLNVSMIGITGSAGKTTTKELLKLALQSMGSAYANTGTFNNNLGVPLTLASVPLDSEFVVIEMGMNHKGEIAELTKLVRPDIAVITNVAPAHLEFFGSVEEIADSKAEIFFGMDNNVTIILNADNPLFSRLEEAANKLGLDDIISFGKDKSAEAKLLKTTVENDRLQVSVDVLYDVVSYSLGSTNIYHALDSVAALAVVHALGGEVALAAKNMEKFTALPGRGLLHRVKYLNKNLAIIDDSYNANPASVAAACETLSMFKGNKIAILGDMLELGATSPKLHAGLADLIEQYKIDQVITVGSLMKNLFDALPVSKQLASFANVHDLISNIGNLLNSADPVCLIKGSRSINMTKLVQFLIKQ